MSSVFGERIVIHVKNLSSLSLSLSVWHEGEGYTEFDALELLIYAP